MYSHILVAYDGSEIADKALHQALKLQGIQQGSKLTALHVMQRQLSAFEGYGWVIPEGYHEKLREFSESLLQKAQAVIQDVPNAETAFSIGNPAIAILDYAKQYNCDLIVMGSRGLGGFKEFMLGSVSHHVVQQAQIPVLIVK